MGPKPPNTTRIYGQNVNGIALDQLGGDFTNLCSIVRESQIDIAGFSEHKLDTTKFLVQQICHNTVKETFPGSASKLVLASSQFQFEGNYKPGGTLLLSTGDIMSRLIDSGKDAMGRWAFQTFASKNNGRVTVINCYQVCEKHSSETGTYTAHAQQVSCLEALKVVVWIGLGL